MDTSVPTFSPTEGPGKSRAQILRQWPPPYQEELKIWAIVLLVLLWGITLPMTGVCSYYTFFKYGDHPTVRHRNKPLLIATQIVAGVFAFIYIPIDTIENAWRPQALRLPDYWGYNGNTTLVFGMMILFFVRFWLCYMLNRKAAESQLWRRQLDPNMRSWVLEYYHVFANPRIIFSVSFVLWIILTCLSFLTPILTKNLYTNIIVSLFSAGSLLGGYNIMLYHIYHFPKDAWGMRIEFTLVVGLISIAYAPAAIFTFWYFFEDRGPKLRQEDRILMLWCVATGFGMALYFWTTGLVPLYTIYAQNNALSKRGSHGPDALIRLLASNRLYEAFCVHLSSEFCVENLLFTVEILQLREYLLATKKITKEDLNKESILYRARVSKHVPFSPIILPYLEYHKKSGKFSKAASLLKARSLSSYTDDQSSTGKESGLNAVSAEVNETTMTDRFAFFSTVPSFSSRLTLQSQKHGSPSLSPISEDDQTAPPPPTSKFGRLRSFTNPSSNSSSPRNRPDFEDNPLTPRQVTISFPNPDDDEIIRKQTSMEPALTLEDLGITNTVLGYRKSGEVRRLLNLNQMQTIFGNDMTEQNSLNSHSTVMSSEIAKQALSELELEEEDTLSPLQEAEMAAAGRKTGHRRISSKLNADAFGTAAELESFKRSAAEFDPARDIEQIYEAIWRKYIGTNAHLMVNISGNLYRKLERRRTNVHAEGFMEDVVGMWVELEEAAKQVFGLLRDSYTRFNYSEVLEDLSVRK